MTLVDSATAKGANVPTVKNETADEPVELGIYEVEPGVVLKLTAADYAADQARRKEAAANHAAWKSADLPKAADAAPAGEVPLSTLKVAELTAIAEGRGLSTTGNKAALVARIGGVESTPDPDDEPAQPPADGATTTETEIPLTPAV